MGNNPIFDYTKEPSRDILCIDCKSFFASCEAVARELNPLTVKLVVMSYPSDNPKERGSGLILASSPEAKKVYGISNVSRARDLPYPYPDDLLIVAPRMNYYMDMNKRINNIYRTFVDDENISVYSVDETFLDVTGSLRYFNCKSTDELARLIQIKVYKETGIYTTVGIGDNPLLAKLALDNEAKKNTNFRAQWRYKDVADKLWGISDITDLWGIGSKTAIRLSNLGISSIYELAHCDYHRLKKAMGIIGTQLYAHAWGIDRTFLGEHYAPKSASLGNSQILNRDYYTKEEIEIVIREMSDQVATRLRRNRKKCRQVSLWVGYSLSFVDEDGRRGFGKQMTIDPTNSSQKIAEATISIFRQYFEAQVVRQIGINCFKLVHQDMEQLNLFETVQEKDQELKFNAVVDTVRKKYGFAKLVYASSLLRGGRAIERSLLVGGHTGGMGGLNEKG